ncbi:MAG: DNA repair protein RecN [Acidimicrobiales bacterium]
MLLELTVSDLGVIDKLSLRLPAGLIALTGETGAGKTLLVDAISLLMGGRADPGLVRPGADEALVDGRFSFDGEGAEDGEIVITRAVPAEGRSRAYINGRPVTVSSLAEVGKRLVDLHGQHSHQSLLGVEAQRGALDSFAKIDRSELDAARRALHEVEDALASLGGDPRSRHREIDLLRYQVDELDAAGVEDADEDTRLAATEEILANAVDHQEAAAAVLAMLADDDGIRDQLSAALPRLDGRAPFSDEAERIRNILADLDDLADGIRTVADTIEQDPEALSAVQARRHQLQQLCRKYGDTLEAVMAEHRSLAEQLDTLEQADRRAEHLDAEHQAALAAVAKAAAKVRAAREAAAPQLAKAIEAYLPELAMPKAKVGISIDGDDGSQVVFQLSANPGSPLQSLAKVASGGELARAMLALRSVLSEAPPILVFDEVDAGIGGQAGFAVGRALAALGDRHQVLVVTHLPQVAAFADAHLAVQKLQGDDDTVSEVHLLDDDQRRTELARMLSGQPDSSTARQHGSELLDEAQAQKRPPTAAAAKKPKRAKR